MDEPWGDAAINAIKSSDTEGNDGSDGKEDKDSSNLDSLEGNANADPASSVGGRHRGHHRKGSKGDKHKHKMYHERKPDIIFDRYLSQGKPVLIRGLFADWPAVQQHQKEDLLRRWGSVRVRVSDIPYSEKFGGLGGLDLTLTEYVQAVEEHTVSGGKHPWYVNVRGLICSC